MTAINSRARLLLTREVGRAMVERGDGGRIVNAANAGLRKSVVEGLAEHRIAVNPVLRAGRVYSLELPLRDEALAGVGPRQRLGKCVAAARRLLGKVDDGRLAQTA